MSRVQIVEVGARDGLQNEKTQVRVEDRLQFALKLADAGLEQIELGAFVSPTWVPQMAGSAELFSQVQAYIKANPKSALAKSKLSALVPNPRGMVDAIRSKVNRVAIFGSASETFSQKNINCSIEESFQRFETIMKMARANKIKVRGYLSMCFGCPFEGDVPEAQVVKLAKRMVKLGVYEVSIGDTIGVADPAQVRRLGKKLLAAVGKKKLAMHFHDTWHGFGEHCRESGAWYEDF